MSGLAELAQPDARGFLTCPCTHHQGSDSKYPSTVSLQDHLCLVEELSKTRSDKFAFLSPHLLENDLLAQHSLLINTQYKLLLCIACLVAVIPSQLKSHLSKHSGAIEKEDLEEISKTLSICGVGHRQLPPLHQDVISKIDGLPIKKGYQCPGCPLVALTLESTKAHMRSKHKGMKYPRERDFVFAQQLKTGLNNQPIRIHTPTDNSISLTTSDILMEAERIMEGIPKISTEGSMDPRDFCPWLRQVRWQDLVAGKDIEQLMALVSLPKTEERELSNLSDGLLHLLQLGSSMFSSTSELILQRLNTPKPVDDVNPMPLKRFQNHDQQLKTYRLPVLGLLAMVLRDCPVPVSPEVHVAIQSLQSSLSSQEVGAISERILDLLSLLWQHPWTPLINHRISDPTIVYLALSSLESTGKFKSAKDVTGVIAKLEYVLRLVFLILINRYQTPESGCEAYQPFFKEGFESTFNSLRNAQRQASSIAYLTLGLPRVFWYDRKHYQELIYHGTHIHIRQLRSLLAALEERMRYVWEEEVLLGLGMRSQHKGEMYDDLANDKVGYSLWTDERNTCFSDKKMLLTAILSDPNLSDKFISFKSGNIVRFNVHMGRAWLSSLTKLHKLMLLRFYITGGAPARGTEMVAMLLQNTASYPLRNLIAFGPYLALVCTYLKTSAISGYDKMIPHALDGFTSDLLIQELAIARPFAMLMASVCYPNDPDIATLFSKHVFVNHTKLFSTKDVTDAFQQFSLVHMNIELGVSDWRHINAAFRRKLCGRLQQLIEEDDNDESIDALQMGHTRQTDNRIYGISQEALRGAAEDILPLFLDASTDWQIVCEVVPGGLRLCYQDALMTSFQSHVASGLIELNTNRTVTIEALFELLKEHTKNIDARFDRMEAKLDLVLSLHSSHSPPSLAPVPSGDAATAMLQKLLRRTDATWKTGGQETAVRAILERKHDVTVILPTNAGKSMVALIPPLLEKDKVTVIILPLRILIMDFERKLQTMDIPFCTYDSTQSRIQLGSANIVLVSADRVQWKDFQQAIVILHQQRPVVRQIIDEAHIPLLSQDFRVSLKHMSNIRCNLPAQLVLLTASGHKELLEAMHREYGIEEHVIVVREPSNRPELQYVWQPIKDIEAMLEAIRVAIEQNILSKRDRGIIFVPWKELGDLIAQRFEYPFYYGGGIRNPEVYKSWLAGQPSVVVATSAFGTGNDYGSVRLVVHAGVPYEMVNYVQEVSRAGRDGSPALCLLLLLSGPNFRPPSVSSNSNDVLNGRTYLAKAVQAPMDHCIRHRITAFSDGNGVHCDSHGDNQPCSRCSNAKKQGRISEHAAPFVQQSEHSKRLRTDRVLTELTYESRLRRCLQLLTKTCSYCMVQCNAYKQPDHVFESCHRLDSKPQFITWRKGIRYPSGVSVCYRCHVPQGQNDSLHPTFNKNATSCEFRDVIAPLVYALLTHADSNERLRNAFPGLSTETPNAALAWINSAAIEGHYTNMVALFMWFTEPYL